MLNTNHPGKVLDKLLSTSLNAVLSNNPNDDVLSILQMIVCQEGLRAAVFPKSTDYSESFWNETPHGGPPSHISNKSLDQCGGYTYTQRTFWILVLNLQITDLSGKKVAQNRRKK
jgi:hypothetical protein